MPQAPGHFSCAAPWIGTHANVEDKQCLLRKISRWLPWVLVLNYVATQKIAQKFRRIPGERHQTIILIWWLKSRFHNICVSYNVRVLGSSGRNNSTYPYEVRYNGTTTVSAYVQLCAFENSEQKSQTCRRPQTCSKPSADSFGDIYLVGVLW